MVSAVLALVGGIGRLLSMALAGSPPPSCSSPCWRSSAHRSSSTGSTARHRRRFPV